MDKMSVRGKVEAETTAGRWLEEGEPREGGEDWKDLIDP